jgi:hypothetical protein
MNSSGIKRGLAGSAITALAISGLPFLASSASAVPNSDASNVAANEVEWYTQLAPAASAKPDGTNSNISLLVGGGTNVTSVQFQYQVNGAGAWTNLGGPVGRNADGVFGNDVNPTFPAGTTTVTFRAIPNTGVANQEDTNAEVVSTNATTKTVELATEGNLGVFQSPYVADADADWVAVTGTTSNAGAITFTSQTGGINATTTATAPAPTGGATTTSFSGIIDIQGYNYAAGTEGDQIVFNAATDAALGNATDDAEGSTLYVQDISQVNAVAKSNNVPAGQDGSVTVTVLDQQGAPVAGASVSYVTPDGADAGTAPDESGDVKTTDAKGKATFTIAAPAAGNYTFYANTDSDVTQLNGDDETSSPVVITNYTQQNATLTAEAVDGFTAFDYDELQLGENGDDFVATLEDQNGNPVAGQSIQYRWNFSPYTGADVEGTYANAGTTNNDGEVAIDFPNAATGGGEYTLEVRRPNVAGSGLLQGTPLTVEVAESEITWADGDQANAEVNGSDTFEGTLELPRSGTPLEDREVTIDDVSMGDAAFSEDQPAGSENNAGTVTATTDADGGFSVSVTDPEIPANIDPTPETVTLTADAEELSGAGDTPNADAQDTLVVNFIETPEVGRIEVDSQTVFGGAPAPGKPVELSVTVFAADDDNDPSNDVELSDYPVTFSADKGFFSPDTVDGLNMDEDDLVLDEDNDDEGDLFGFYENLGANEVESSTGDNDEAGIVAAIERDEDFDDDGLSEMTVTITAGAESEEVTVEFDARNYLNLTDVSLERADGQPAGDVTVGDSVDFQLFAQDQFGNLVGDQDADVSDDTPLADVNTDGNFGETRTDFENDNAGITATSDNEVVQTVMARLGGVNEGLVDDDGDYDGGTRSVSDSESITWTDEPDVPPVTDCDAVAPSVLIAGESNGARKDVVRFQTEDCAVGDEVTLYKIRGKKSEGNKRLVKIRSTESTEDGNLTFKVADRNGNQKTRFVAKVRDASDYGIARSNTQKLR